jgi:hypothetical protein
MFSKLAFASGLMAASLLASSAMAAPQLSGSPPGAGPLAEPAQFWDLNRCRGWRRECAERWGWRTDRWHRCLARHGCERHRYDDRWDR